MKYFKDFPRNYPNPAAYSFELAKPHILKEVNIENTRLGAEVLQAVDAWLYGSRTSGTLVTEIEDMEAYQKHTDLRFNRADEHYCLVQSERLAGAPAGALDLVYVEPHQGEANHNKWFTDEIELEDFLIPDFEMNRLKMISSKGRTALRLRLKDIYWPIPVRRVIRVNLYPLAQERTDLVNARFEREALAYNMLFLHGLLTKLAWLNPLVVLGFGRIGEAPWKLLAFQELATMLEEYRGYVYELADPSFTSGSVSSLSERFRVSGLVPFGINWWQEIVPEDDFEEETTIGG